MINNTKINNIADAEYIM